MRPMQRSAPSVTAGGLPGTLPIPILTSPAGGSEGWTLIEGGMKPLLIAVDNRQICLRSTLDGGAKADVKFQGV